MTRSTPGAPATGSARAARVHVLALHDCTPIVPVGVADLLRKAAVMAATMPVSAPALQVTLVSPGPARRVVAAGGLVLECDATLRDAGAADVIVVPALDPEVLERLARNRAVVPWLKRAFARGTDVASACTGAFVLGAAGLLDGRAATTHWAFQAQLAERYPRMRLAPQAVLVDQGRVITAGGATAFLNLTLFLVERLLGAEVAWAASRMFLIETNKAPQGAYAMFSTQKSHGDEAVLRAQALIEAELSGPLQVDALARRVAMSRRTFARRFLSATGNTPREYIHRVRIEAAKRALERSADPVAAIAAQVGYGDVVAFRKLFVRTVGLTPVEYRARYGPRAAPAFVLARPRAVSASRVHQGVQKSPTEAARRGATRRAT